MFLLFMRSGAREKATWNKTIWWNTDKTFLKVGRAWIISKVNFNQREIILYIIAMKHNIQLFFNFSMAVDSAILHHYSTWCGFLLLSIDKRKSCIKADWFSPRRWKFCNKYVIHWTKKNIYQCIKNEKVRGNLQHYDILSKS